MSSGSPWIASSTLIGKFGRRVPCFPSLETEMSNKKGQREEERGERKVQGVNAALVGADDDVHDAVVVYVSNNSILY